MANESILINLFDMDNLVSPLQQNLIKILNREGPLTRKELVIQLRTPRTTIYDNLLKLQKRKVVEKFIRNNSTRGRPLVFWKIRD